MSSGGSWHAVLGVGKNAGKSEIIKAYRTLALQHHPDKGGSEEKFKEINGAYEEKRRMNFLSGNKYKMWQAKQEKKKDSQDRQAFMEAKAEKARQAGYRGGAKASNGCDIRIPKQDSGSRDTKEGKGGKKKNAKGKDKDAEGNKIGRGIGDDSTKLAEDQFCTVTVTGDTVLKANGGKRSIQLMLGYGQTVERALADLGVEAKMPSLEEMTDGKSKEKKDSSSPADVRAAAARAEGQEAPTWVYEAKAKSVASPVEVETKNGVDPVDSPSSPAAKQINNLMAYEMASQRDRLACSKEFVQRTAAQKMVQEEGLHPEWSLTQCGLSSGSSLQVEDEGQGRSINLVIREEPDLDEQLYPRGFEVEAGAGAGEEAAKVLVKEAAEKLQTVQETVAKAADLEGPFLGEVDENDMFSNLAWVFSSMFSCCIRGSPSF